MTWLINDAVLGVCFPLLFDIWDKVKRLYQFLVIAFSYTLRGRFVAVGLTDINILRF